MPVVVMVAVPVVDFHKVVPFKEFSAMVAFPFLYPQKSCDSFWYQRVSTHPACPIDYISIVWTTLTNNLYVTYHRCVSVFVEDNFLILGGKHPVSLADSLPVSVSPPVSAFLWMSSVRPSSEFVVY